MLRVGLIGFGLAGQAFHAPTIRAVPGMELACILERSGGLAAKRYPSVRVVRTLDELLADETIRLVVVATPNTSHFDLTKRCLLAGRDVVVDKPFTPTYEEAAELVRLAEQHKRLLTVYQNRRFDGDFRTVRKIVASGALGRIVEYECSYERFRLEAQPNAWREREEPGAGVLFDLGPHVIDQALLLFGAPQTITARAFSQREWAKVDDAFDVTLEYPHLRAHLRGRIVAFVPGPHFVLHGTRGSFVKCGMDPQEEPLRKGDCSYNSAWGVEPEANWGTLSLLEGNSRVDSKVKTETGDYPAYYAAVRDAVEKGAPPPVTPREALNTMRALILAHKSSREGRTVIWNENL